jgi:hypothetical protein
MIRQRRAFAVVLVLTMAGCARVAPPITEVEGVVLLNKQPLPNAYVEFVPELEHFGAELNSRGITDDQGRFQLVCAQHQQAGAVVAKHRVLVLEAPTPEEFRQQTQEAQEKYAQYRAKLKNRPIPSAYASVSQSPLRVEVTADRKSYTLDLSPINSNDSPRPH